MILKKFFITSLLCSAAFFSGILDGGFDTKFNKYINFYFIDPHLDWGNLYVEGVDVDFKAAVLAQKKLKGGYFDDKIHSVVPTDFSQTDQEWHKAKNEIAHLIGFIPLVSAQESKEWKNSAKNVEDLLQDAHQAAPFFKNDFQNITLRTRSTINFGPDNQFIVKTKESLIGKVDREVKDSGITKEEAVSKIPDALRGTIIVDDVNKIPDVIAEMIHYSAKKGAKIAFKNIWKEDRESGYTGIHAKILYPLPGSTERYLLAEMQIHLDSIVDGTPMSAKERQHLIYEYTRLDKANQSDTLMAASKLLFLAAMEDALGKLKTKG